MNESCMKALCAFCFMEDHIGHKKKSIQTVFKEGKQEVAAAIETIDEKIRKLERQLKCMELGIKRADRDQLRQLKLFDSFTEFLKEALKIRINQSKAKMKDWTDSYVKPAIDEFRKFKDSF